MNTQNPNHTTLENILKFQQLDCSLMLTYSVDSHFVFTV